ncbi:thiamine pyrophosphate-binding protein [Mariprofundus sp. NF]|uniref:thiamine pyrophosphate-binding protein n=1 Tax=Mariprofundus sp. NF TaxID=2608716 RepID=UPI0015A025DD|nr:thiamine pyrophosphate-binding protein [Mariprofundus sp. NF]NWF39827.1 thiamine pyrophosphate-binding protein [Mariprofundus sp. NF]
MSNVIKYPVPEKVPDEIQNGDLLVHYLEKEGVEYVFGIPGGALEPVYNALAKAELRGGLKPILTKHEQGAAFMADGYSRVSGTLGVCCATTGPGATNLFAGITTSYADSIPVLALTAQIPISKFGKSAFQDSSHEGIDVVEIFKKSTNYSAMIINASLADDMFRKAIRMALSGKRGPVHLSLPSDVMAEKVDENAISHSLFSSYNQPQHFDRSSVKEAVKLIGRAKKAAMLVGSGTLWSGATKEVKELAELLTIPTATTPKAKGTFPENHELALGCFGFGGSPRADAYLLDEDVDLLIAVGTSFNEWATHGWSEKLARGKTIIQIDIDPNQFGRNYASVIPLSGDAKVVVKELLYELERMHRVTSVERHIRTRRFVEFADKHPMMLELEKITSEASPIKPQRLMADIRAAVPDETIFFIDIGNNLAWALHYLPIIKPGTFFAALGFSCMGYGVAASIGGKLAAKERPVVAIVGDGGFLMNGTELSTAVSHCIPVIWVILNDGGLGMVRHGQSMSEQAMETSHTFASIDFVGWAESFGAVGVRINKPGALNRKLINKLIALKRPVVINVQIDRDEVPPIGSRLSALREVYREE